MRKWTPLIVMGVCTLLLHGCKVNQPTTPDGDIETTAVTEMELQFIEDLNSVTLEELTETELKSVKGWNEIKYPLIAEIPEKNIYMYGYNGEHADFTGVVLRVGDQLQTFVWEYIANDEHPELFVSDLDEDGKEELICILHSGFDTWYSVYDLHILEPSADGTYMDIQFRPEDYQRQLMEMINFEYDKVEKLMKFASKNAEISATYYGEAEAPDGIVFDSMIHFDFKEDRLRLLARPLILESDIDSQRHASTVFFADIQYQKEAFTLGDVYFSDETFSGWNQEAQEAKFLRNINFVSLDLLSEKEMAWWYDEWDETKYPLIARIPEANISFYGYYTDYTSSQGIILRVEDSLQTFVWNYSTVRGLPEASLYDIDGDGKDEIIFIVHHGSGTGIAIYNLYILDPAEDGTYNDIYFEREDYEKQLKELVDFEYNEVDGMMRFFTKDAEMTEFYYGWNDEEKRIPDDIDFGGIIAYEFSEDTLRLLARPSLIGEGVCVPDYPDTQVVAEVRIEDGEFVLSNVSFINDLDKFAD